MKLPLISVVIPVYNAEKTIAKCIDSVLAQTYQEFEILLIDDGSCDNSGTICQDYADKDARIRYIKKENGGVSTARNRGIDEAKGEYITFIDSDDWVENNALEYLADAAVKNNADIVSPRCRGLYLTASGDFEKYVLDPDDFQVIVPFENLAEKFDELLHACLLYSVCGRLYKKDLLKNNIILFNPKIRILEDFCFTLQCLSCMERFVHIDKVTYNYTVINDGNYQFKRNYSAYIESIDYVYNTFFTSLENNRIPKAKEYYDFILGYWILAIQSVVKNGGKKKFGLLHTISDFVKKENLLPNCSLERIDTQYRILFNTNSVTAFFLVSWGKRIKSRCRKLIP